MDLRKQFEKKLLAEATLVRYYNWRIDPKYSSFSNRNVWCSICTEELNKEYVLILPCGDAFHHDCILSWYVDHKKKSCPDCTYVLREKI